MLKNLACLDTIQLELYMHSCCMLMLENCVGYFKVQQNCMDRETCNRGRKRNEDIQKKLKDVWLLGTTLSSRFINIRCFGGVVICITVREGVGTVYWL